MKTYEDYGAELSSKYYRLLSDVLGETLVEKQIIELSKQFAIQDIYNSIGELSKEYMVFTIPRAVQQQINFLRSTIEVIKTRL